MSHDEWSIELTDESVVWRCECGATGERRRPYRFTDDQMRRVATWALKTHARRARILRETR
jgi:hypothetical protein